jgi:hypothetical protein
MGQPKRREKEGKDGKDGSAAAAAVAAPGRGAEPTEAAGSWSPPASNRRATWAVLAGVVVLVNLPLLHYYLVRGQVPATAAVPYADDFSSPDTVAEHYSSIGGLWRVVNGELLSPGVKNNPLWLKASLPADVAVEFDARSMSPEGDIKAEIFGDGTDHASGYILIHGGWNNSLSIIARLDEHGASLQALQAEAQRRGNPDLVQSGVVTPRSRLRVEANPYPVQLGRTYHWRIERRGPQLTWFIDGQKFMEFNDPFPLVGKGHDRFGFSSWEAQLYFDNLRVTPL